MGIHTWNLILPYFEGVTFSQGIILSTLNVGRVPSVHASTSCWLRTPSTDGSILSKQARTDRGETIEFGELGSLARDLGFIRGFNTCSVSKFRGPTIRNLMSRRIPQWIFVVGGGDMPNLDPCHRYPFIYTKKVVVKGLFEAIPA